MRSLIILLLLIVTTIPSMVTAQNDSLSRKFKSIKVYTLGDKFEKEGWGPAQDDLFNVTCYKDRISLGSFEDVDLFIYLTDDDTIYKLSAEGMSCGSSADKAKIFRMDIQEHYDIVFKLLPVKPMTPYKPPINGGYYLKETNYIYEAYKNDVKYTLTTTNSGFGVVPSKISMFMWNVSFSMTVIALEKRKKQQDKIKSLQEQSKAKSNF
jgi:hypothetical protein